MIKKIGLIGEFFKIRRRYMKSNIFRFIEDLGRKSKPVLSYFIECYDFQDEELKRFVLGIIYFFSSDFKKVIDLYSRGFQALKYDIRASQIQLIIFHVLHDKKNLLEHYQKLKKLIPFLSKDLRYDTQMSIGAFEMIYFGNFKRIEKLKITNNACRNIFYYYFQAQMNFNYKKNFNTGINFIQSAYSIVKKIKMPTIEAMILNLYVYNMIKFSANENTFFLTEKLAFLIGYWYDIYEYESCINFFDTVQKVIKKPRYYIILSNVIVSSNKSREKIHPYELCHKELESNNILSLYEFECKKIPKIKIPIEYYISHLRKFSNKEFIEKEIAGRVLKNRIFCTRYEDARLKRVNDFVINLNDSKKKKMSNFYYFCTEKEKEYLDTFIINYSIYMEYSNKINSFGRKKDKKFVYSFFQKTTLNPLVATIACCVWQTENKNNALNIIQKMIEYIYT